MGPDSKQTAADRPGPADADPAALPCEFCGGGMEGGHEVTLGSLRGELRSCVRCRSAQIRPPFADEEVNRYYQTSYFQATPAEVEKARALARDYVKKIRSRGGKRAFSGKLLEIGCGLGHFAGLVQRRFGAAMDVVEPSEVCRDYTRAHFSLGRFFGDLEEVPPGSGYENVFCFHVVEHLQRLGGFLDRLAGITAGGARVWILTPNAVARSRAMFGSQWGWTASPVHYQFLSPDLPDEYFSRHGFRVVSRADVLPAKVHFPSCWQLLIQYRLLASLTGRISRVKGWRRQWLRAIRGRLPGLMPRLDQGSAALSLLSVERTLAGLLRLRPYDELFLVLERTSDKAIPA